MSKCIEKIIKLIAKMIPAGKRGCLIMDSVSFHRNEEILNSISALGFDVALLPPGSTSDLQPLDLSKMKPFKD